MSFRPGGKNGHDPVRGAPSRPGGRGRGRPWRLAAVAISTTAAVGLAWMSVVRVDEGERAFRMEYVFVPVT